MDKALEVGSVPWAVPVSLPRYRHENKFHINSNGIACCKQYSMSRVTFISAMSKVLRDFRSIFAVQQLQNLIFETTSISH